MFTFALSCSFRMLHTSVVLKKPSAAALFEACLLCVHSFLHLPGVIIDFALQLISSLPLPVVGRIPSVISFLGKLFSFCCRVDNRNPPPSAASQVSLDLLEWESLATSAKSAFLSDHEANNSIVQVAASMFQSACTVNASFDSFDSSFAVCHGQSCCALINVSLSNRDSQKTESLSNSLIANQSPESSELGTRHMLRALLGGTRRQLRSMQSPLQQDTNGFDSWRHLITSLNPCNRSADSAVAVSVFDSSDIVRQRCSLHKRMCRINKWQLLLRLHHMPWLRLLRRHALVQPPSQPHLAWRSSNLLLSNISLSQAAAAVSFKIHSHQETICPSDAEDSAFNQSVDAFQAMMEQHSRMLSRFQSERASPRAASPEWPVGCGWCCTCDSCRDRSNPTGGTMNCIKRMYQ
jgi:hypothetical protein